MNVDVVAIANSAGFSITNEDLNSGRQSLFDEELEAAAGGTGVLRCDVLSAQLSNIALCCFNQGFIGN